VTTDPVLEIRNLQTAFGKQVVHRGVSFSLKRGTVNALIGGSGSGKTTLLKAVLGLLKPTGGEILLFGEKLTDSNQSIRKRYGVLFQNGALYSALTVGQNVAVPLVEQTDFSESTIRKIVRLRLVLSGLDVAVTDKMPSELSGGMRKRVALARALALEPELLFLDEPTSGLDPINARAFDQLIRTLTDSLGLTTVMVTHDLDSILGIADRVLVLGEGKLIADGSAQEVAAQEHPWIKDYFAARVEKR
jgi:phospholipid/cholesterol/gamma-HCH transport system ATP-binding protein